MKKDFVLPEKWCILWESREKYEVINDYLNVVRNMNWSYSSDFVHAKALVTYKNDYINNNTPNKIPRGYTLISFEQFCKYVLKEEVKHKELVEEDLNYLIPLFKKMNII